MGRNTVTVTLNNLDIPQPLDYVAEPIFAFKTSVTEILITTQVIPIDYASDSVIFVENGDVSDSIPIIKDENDIVIPSVPAVDSEDPQPGEYTVVYDSLANETTFTFYFTDAATIIAFGAVQLFFEVGESVSILLPGTFEKQIDLMSLTSGEKTTLKQFIQAGFLQSVTLGYAKVFLFNDYDQLKSYQLSVQNANVVNINFYSVDIVSYYDLAKNFRYFMSYNNETPSQIESLATTYINTNGFSNIVIVQSESLALARITFQYFARVANFIAVNISAFEIQGLTPVTDETRKAFYRDNKILFYTLMNEDFKDGYLQLKEGVALDNNKIDLITSLNWLVIQARLNLIATYFANGGDNTKLDQILSSGGRESVYSSSLKIFFERMIRQRIILSYENLQISIEQTQELNVTATVDIRYNKSSDAIQLIITNLPALALVA